MAIQLTRRTSLDGLSIFQMDKTVPRVIRHLLEFVHAFGHFEMQIGAFLEQ